MAPKNGTTSVGPRTAEILVACLDDPHRFKNGREVAAYFGLVPRKYQSGDTDRNGRITKRGNPLARTILVECVWASLRYNPWAKAVYQRISGQQKTRRKKAAVALARKIAVIAWAMLRDEQDWEPQRIIEVAETFGKMPLSLKVTLQDMKPKENSDQRKSRLRKEARQAREAKTDRTPKAVNSSKTAINPKSAKGNSKKPKTLAQSKKSKTPTSSTRTSPKRVRQPVSPSDAHALRPVDIDVTNRTYSPLPTTRRGKPVTLADP